MPNFEPVVTEGRGYALRHIGPKDVIWPNPPIAIPAFVFLGQDFMIARPLPMTNNPNSFDMVSGSWTGRLGDAGEFTLTFPNKEASDGQAWRNRFAGDGRLQWIEIYNDGYLESCCFIEKPDLKRDQVVISGHDGWFALKGAYERDWTVVQAPRDVIERGTQLWVPIITDDFMSTSLNQQWQSSTSGGTTGIKPNGGLQLTVIAAAGSSASISGPITTPPVQPTGIWTVTCTVQAASIPTTNSFQLALNEGAVTYSLRVSNNLATIYSSVGPTQFGMSSNISVGSFYSLVMESDGEWIWGYVNGQFIGGTRRSQVSSSTFNVSATLGATQIDGTVSSGVASVTVTGILLEVQQPFLQRGTDKGDYVLPGDITSYPWGGLHGRYFNNADLQADTPNHRKIHHPSRTVASTGGGGSEYANRQDATINFTSPFQVVPGAASSYYSVTWFGAIYLKLSLGSYPIQFTVDDGVRVWVGKTKWGDQLIDSWIPQAATPYTATINTATLGTKDGWYPIKIEYFQDGSTANAQFFFTPPNGYTDPGGTVLTGGAQVIVPATSLSPLGCVDQRHQGISHFDLVQKTGVAFGYQLAVEPKQLESGLFPGVLAPRLREGQDTDAILEPDDHARTEGLLNYGNVLDSTDICTSLQGNGAGFQSGNGGQLQARVYDPTHMRNALYDIQGWQDFSDAAFASLLQALLDNQLGLRLEPWQIVTGDPIGRPRLANSWPLPGTLVQQRWRPGDGMRIHARDINLFDTTPRQLLLITRQIHPNGSTGVQVSFAARPRSAEHQLKQTMFTATRWQRNYQGQFVTLSGAYIQAANVGASGFGGYSLVAAIPSDLIVRVYVRINYNSAAVPMGIEINGVDRTSALNGPWTTVPINLDITALATPEINNRIYVRIINSGGITSTFEYQLFVDVHGR